MTDSDQKKMSPLSSLGQKGGVWLMDRPWPSSSLTGLQERLRGGQGGPTGSDFVYKPQSQGRIGAGVEEVGGWGGMT